MFALITECGNLDSIGANLENTDDLISTFQVMVSFIFQRYFVLINNIFYILMFQLTDDLLSDVNLIDHSIRSGSKW